MIWSIVLAAQLLQVPAPSFTTYTIRSGDTLGKLFQQSERIEFVARYNGLEPRYLKIDRTIMVPVDWQTCRGYVPMAAQVDSLSSWPQCTLIDLSQQFLGAYEYGRLVQYCRISSGVRGYETPTGRFRVSGHDIDHTSNLYETSDGRPFPMPYAVYVTGAVWIHQGELPGQPASHGCIRLRRTDAAWYYDWAEHGGPTLIEL